MTLQNQANADIGAGYSEHNVHNSVKHLSVEERKRICLELALPYEVAIINVTGELNVGNIIRSASLCGARRVHVLGRRRYDTRGTVGTTKYIDVERINTMTESDELDLDAIVTYFNEKNLYPIFIEQHDHSISLDQLGSYIQSPLRGNYYTPCLVFGNEGRGIPIELINKFPVSHIVQLTQRGVIRSFNVGSTAAIVLYKMQELFNKDIICMSEQNKQS